MREPCLHVHTFGGRHDNLAGTFLCQIETKKARMLRTFSVTRGNRTPDNLIKSQVLYRLS